MFVTETEFFLFAGRPGQDPLPEGGYFTQFCLTVMTYQIKSVFTYQHVVKRADQATGLNLHLRHHIIDQRHALTMHGGLYHHRAVAEDRPLLHINMLQPQLAGVSQPVTA